MTNDKGTDTALVEALFAGEDYDFLRTVGGRRLYFHRHSVVNGGFGEPGLGRGVRFVEEQGAEEPRAAAVQVVSRHPPKQ